MSIKTSADGAKKEINRIIHSADGAKRDIGKMYHGVNGSKKLVYDSRKYGKAIWSATVGAFSYINCSPYSDSGTYSILPELSLKSISGGYMSELGSIEFKLENTKVKKGDVIDYEYFHNYGTHAGTLNIDFYDGRTTNGVRLYNKKINVFANTLGTGKESLRIESEINSYLNLHIGYSLEDAFNARCIFKVYNVYLNGHRIG